MSDAKLNTTFEKALPGIVTQIAEDLAQLLGLTLEVDTESIDFLPITSVYPGEGDSGVVCGRAAFTRKANGVGGFLLHERAANRLSHAAMMMDPPGENEPIDWEGLVREAMDEIFNVAVGSWNNSCPADLRMGSSVDERSVEYYPAGGTFPEAAGILPMCVDMPLTLGDFTERLTFFLPINAVHGRSVAGFSGPDQFVKSPRGDHETTPSVAPQSAAPPEIPHYDGPVRPVVFVDYTGAVVAWIRHHAALSKVRALKSDGPSPEMKTEETPPAATVLIGVNPTELNELSELPFVEIRPTE